MIFYPLAALLISAAFALTLAAQYRAKRRPYLLAWTVALAVYAVAALTEVVGAAAGWNPTLYRTYYFLGGILLVGVLGLGTVNLLATRFARFSLLLLVALAGLGLVGVAGAGLQTSLLQTHGVPSPDTIPAERSFFNVMAIAMAATINIAGSLVLIGGCLWSAYRMWVRGDASSRLAANILIAAGAFIVAGASSLTRFHVYELFYVGQAIGVLVMFAGFLAAQRVPRRVANLGTA